MFFCAADRNHLRPVLGRLAFQEGAAEITVAARLFLLHFEPGRQRETDELAEDGRDDCG